MLEAFPEVIGFSDHTEGIWAAPAAVALGARFIEKHFTIDRGLPGPDHALSVEPDELRQLSEAVGNVFDGLGSGVKEPTEQELKNRHRGRKGVYAARDLEPGIVLTREDVKISRPEGPIAAMNMKKIIGIKLARPVSTGTELVWDDFGSESGFQLNQ
jgi:sialic acid synthase SpsE